MKCFTSLNVYQNINTADAILGEKERKIIKNVNTAQRCRWESISYTLKGNEVRVAVVLSILYGYHCNYYKCEVSKSNV